MNAPLQIDVSLSPEVRVRTWHLPNLEVPRWPANVHETVELAWVDQGGLTYAIDGRTMIVRRGSAILVPPGVEHKTTIAPMTRAGSIHLAFDMFAGVAGELGLTA